MIIKHPRCIWNGLLPCLKDQSLRDTFGQVNTNIIRIRISFSFSHGHYPCIFNRTKVKYLNRVKSNLLSCIMRETQ